MPDPNVNIPSHALYGSEFLCIARPTPRHPDSLPSAISLFKRMVSQGGSESLILRQIEKVINRHPEPFSKFSKPAEVIMKDISSG
jgi:hypothetical protein